MKKQTILITLSLLFEVVFITKIAMCVEFHITTKDGTVWDCSVLDLQKESVNCASNHIEISLPKSDLKKVTVFQDNKNFEIDIETTDYNKLCNIVNQLSANKKQTISENARQVAEQKSWDAKKAKESARKEMRDFNRQAVISNNEPSYVNDTHNAELADRREEDKREQQNQKQIECSKFYSNCLSQCDMERQFHIGQAMLPTNNCDGNCASAQANCLSR